MLVLEFQNMGKTTEECLSLNLNIFPAHMPGDVVSFDSGVKFFWV